LTPPGEILFDFVRPFFDRLDEVEEMLRGRMTIRLVGLTEVMREHVPTLLAGLRAKHPGLKVTLQEIDQRGAELLIGRGEADLAITVLESKLPPGFRSVTLARLPLCLLVPADSGHRRAMEVLKSGAAGKLPLISLPPHEMLPRLFQKELTARGIRWKTELETSSQDLVSIYVRSGLGVGLSVQTPDLVKDPRVKLLPLKGFPSLPVGVFWRGKLPDIPQKFLEQLIGYSKTWESLIQSRVEP
jgi:DNA-binding transcriptional LysR family regulator